MRSLATCAIMLTAILAMADEPKNVDHIRVLIVTGVDHPAHRWQETAPALRRVLEQDKRFEVRIVEDPDFLASPAVANYDVILLHFKNYAPLPHESQARENLEKLVKQGKGLTLIHFASGAFEDWPAFANLAGKVWDRKTSHDPRGPFTVKVVQAEHAITREMRDFPANDELYTCLVGDRHVEVLATARSKITGKDHPMAFVFKYGEGRVFHTPLGHDVRAIEMPGVAELIRRGCLWTAGRLP
jgi:uncharacterized protein